MPVVSNEILLALLTGFYVYLKIKYIIEKDMAVSYISIKLCSCIRENDRFLLEKQQSKCRFVVHGPRILCSVGHVLCT
jgi:hypothetical protein